MSRTRNRLRSFWRRDSDERRQATNNGLWNVAQQFVSTGLNALLGILLILLLPVEEVGLYNYATALAGLGATVMSAGLSGLAVRYLVKEPEASAQTVATLILTREFFALLGFGIVALVSLTSGSRIATAAAVIASLSLFARAFDAPDLWFLANLRSRTPATIKIVCGALFFVTRVLVLLLLPSLAALICLLIAEAAVVSMLILVFYRRSGGAPGLARPAKARVQTLLRDSWPLLLSGFAYQMASRSGTIVLQAQSGASSVAVYSAAVRFTELTFLLPAIFMNSTLPLLIRSRDTTERGGERYLRMLQRSYDQAFWVGVAAGGGVWAAGGAIIALAFGAEYAGAVNVLAITCLSCPFVFMAAVYSKWIISEGHYLLSLLRHAAAMVTAVGGAVLLVPVHGIEGAAFSWLIASVVGSYLTAFVGRRSRPAAMQMTLAMIAPVRVLSGRRRQGRRGVMRG